MLRLDKHPDRGGDIQEAQTINEAYEILRDPAKRAVYDRLSPGLVFERAPQTHSSSAPAAASVAPGGKALLEKVRSHLSAQYREVGDSPLAAAFDLLLEGPAPFKNRLMFSVYDRFRPDDWSRVFGLFRLVNLHRSSWLPGADAVVVVADEVEDRNGFLRECLRRSSVSQWAWGPRSLALLEGGRLYSEFFLYLAPPLADLRSVLAVST